MFFGPNPDERHGDGKENEHHRRNQGGSPGRPAVSCGKVPGQQIGPQKIGKPRHKQKGRKLGGTERVIKKFNMWERTFVLPKKKTGQQNAAHKQHKLHGVGPQNGDLSSRRSVDDHGNAHEKKNRRSPSFWNERYEEAFERRELGSNDPNPAYDNNEGNQKSRFPPDCFAREFRQRVDIEGAGLFRDKETLENEKNAPRSQPPERGKTMLCRQGHDTEGGGATNNTCQSG